MAFKKALQQLNRGLTAVGLCPVPGLIPGRPGDPVDCTFQRAFRPADPNCEVGVTHVFFDKEHVAKSLAAAWGSINGDDRYTFHADKEKCRHSVELPRAMRNYIQQFDRYNYIEGIDFGVIDEETVALWREKLTDRRLAVLLDAWTAEQERRAFVGV